MRRADRLFQIIQMMRGGRLVTAAQLAERLEVTERTIYRDIVDLRSSGAPIDGEAGVGYMLRPGFDLPNVTFTHDQLDALAIGLAFVERTGDATLATAAREARIKLQAGLPDPEERKLADAPFFSLRRRERAALDSELVREAIRRRQILRIAYADADGSPSLRTIRPVVIWDIPDGWMVSAWCDLRKDFRTFRFDRISRLELTGACFEEEEDKSLSAFLASEPCEH